MRLLLAGSAAVLFAWSAAAEENLLRNGDFEIPAVKARTPVREGGTPARESDNTSWTIMLDTSKDPTGKIVAGLTNEIARGGKQSIFVDFQKVSAKRKVATLVSGLFPVKAGVYYKTSIWGRLDRKRPLTLDQRRPNMLVEAEFFSQDQEEQVGDTHYRVQMLPGSIIPGTKPRLIFTAAKWTQYATDFRVPEGAAFMKVTFIWRTPQAEGVTDGTLFMDDAAVELDPEPLLTESNDTEEPMDADDAPAAKDAVPPPAAPDAK